MAALLTHHMTLPHPVPNPQIKGYGGPMRLMRRVLGVAGLAAAVMAVRALRRGRGEPASLDSWPPVPRKVATTG